LQYEFFVRGWRQLGMDVVVDATSYNQFQDKIRRNAYQIFLWGWVGDYPDPENFLFLLWSESSPHPNSSQFKNAKYDELFLAMKARENDAERARLIREMLGILEWERPWIELYHSEEYALIHSWVNNVKPAGLSLPAIKYRDLDPIERTRKRDEWNEPVLWPVWLLLDMFAAAIVPGVITFFRERQ
jgi:ABC-type oligopeptide transport system substrate-binding subunit